MDVGMEYLTNTLAFYPAVVLQTASLSVYVMVCIFFPGMISTHFWCIQQHFLSAVKVVTTMQCSVWGLAFTNQHNVSDGLESCGMWQCARVTAYYRKHFLQYSTSLNIKSLNSDVYSKSWFEKVNSAAVLKKTKTIRVLVGFNWL